MEGSGITEKYDVTSLDRLTSEAGSAGFHWNLHQLGEEVVFLPPNQDYATAYQINSAEMHKKARFAPAV